MQSVRTGSSSGSRATASGLIGIDISRISRFEVGSRSNVPRSVFLLTPRKLGSTGDQPGVNVPHVRQRRRLELRAKLRIIRVFLTFVGLVLSASPALGSSVEVRCHRLSGPNRAELQARARLLLLGAGMDTARIGVDCDGSTAWLVWVDGGKTRIDETSGIVEGALDVIEDRLAQAKTAPRPPPSAAVPPPASEAPPLGPPSSGAVEREPSAPRQAPEKVVEGGVGLGAAMEFGSASVLVGPRLEVGLAMGRKLTLVIGEGARFGAGSPQAGQVMVFDLQAGVAFGAPYEGGAIGVALLGGAERMAVSTGGFSGGDAWAWGATVSLGLRGSVALGPIDAWVGVDGIARSSTIETGEPGQVAIPRVSALVSFGGFLPAIANAQPPTSAKR